MLRLIIISAILFSPALALAKKVKYRKTQTINFDGADIDGVARAPDGAYLHQRRGVKFLPLYKVKKSFDNGVKKSVDFLR